MRLGKIHRRKSASRSELAVIFLLDTDTCSYAMKRSFPGLVAKLSEFAPRELKVSVVTVFELEYGAQRSGRCEQLRRVIGAFLENVEVLQLDQSAACHAGSIRAHLAKSGNLIGAYDLLIAGHARAVEATLVTHNIREFSRVQGLSVEDWATG